MAAQDRIALPFLLRDVQSLTGGYEPLILGVEAQDGRFLPQIPPRGERAVMRW